MNKKILGCSIIVALSLVFFGKATLSNELLNLKTIEALSEDDEWRNAGIPNAKTIHYTVPYDHTVENLAFTAAWVQAVGGTAGVTTGIVSICTAGGAGAAGGSIVPGVGTVIGGVCGIIGGVISYAIGKLTMHEDEQLNCCTGGYGTCYPFAPDKSPVERCKAEGFLVGM